MMTSVGMRAGEQHHGWKGGYRSYRRRAIKQYGAKCSNEHCPIPTTRMSTKMLDVDHTDGNRENNDITNLRVLCVWCHAERTAVHGNSYGGKATWCGTSLPKKQFPASITRRARATSFEAHKLGWFDSNFRLDEDSVHKTASSVSVSGTRGSTAGHLNMDQANNRQQHSPR